MLLWSCSGNHLPTAAAGLAQGCYRNPGLVALRTPIRELDNVDCRSMIHITELVEISEEVVAAFSHLIPQLSPATNPPSADQLKQIAADPNIVLYVARETDSGDIAGTLTLVFFGIPSGLQARIEDVVVDAAARGHGVGELLTNTAINRARAAGAKSIGLTSRPSREAANRLYVRLGFEIRQTNVYRLKLGI